MKYKYAIGAGAGFLSNKLIQDNTQDFWLEQGTRAAEKRQRAYDAALQSGQTPEQADIADSVRMMLLYKADKPLNRRI